MKSESRLAKSVLATSRVHLANRNCTRFQVSCGALKKDVRYSVDVEVVNCSECIDSYLTRMHRVKEISPKYKLWDERFKILKNGG